MSNQREIKKNGDAGASTGCLVCGQPIRYEVKETVRTCVLCKRQFQSNSQCENGHYVLSLIHILRCGPCLPTYWSTGTGYWSRLN